MIKFLIVFCSMAAMFFAFGQGMDEGKNSDCHIGFKGVIFFGLLELLLMFLLQKIKMNIFEIDAIDLTGIICLVAGISWLLSLLLCWWKGDFDYLIVRTKKLYRLYEEGR